MHTSSFLALLTALATYTSAIPSNPFLAGRQASGGFSGVATFNDYVDQVNNRNQPTVCGDFNDDLTNQVFAAAAGDLSPNISPGQCSYSANDSAEVMQGICTQDGGQQPDSSVYHGPPCPLVNTQTPTPGKANCGQQYKVTNNDTGKSVTIKIVDACPAKSAYNYCKTNTPDSGKCAGPKDALDISVKAYPILANTDPSTGVTGSTQNLENLSITPI